jgi:hypothetical protein
MVRFAPGLPLMVANVQAQLEVLWQHRTPVWFLDTDVLLLKPLPELWEEQLVVTWRDNLGGRLKDADNQTVAHAMPYNFGVMGVHPGPKVFEAFVWLRERVRQMQPQLRDWYGNQVALAALAGPRPDEGERTDTRAIPWMLTEPSPSLTVRKIPCETWNYTPADADEDVTEKGALHFKGHSRPLMSLFATRLGLEWPMEAAA